MKLRAIAPYISAGATVMFLAITVGSLIAASTLLAGDAHAQARRGRLQKRLEKLQERQRTNKLNQPGGQTGNSATDGSDVSTRTNAATSLAPKTGQQTGKHSLDGVKAKGPRAIFTDEERELIIPGLGNPAAMLIIFRQLDLTDQQKQEIKAIRNRITNRLAILQTEHRQLDAQLTDAIYGEAFDPNRVDELAAQVAGKQGEIIKLRASIEAQLRQLMTPDQFYVFHLLIGEMVLPQRRIAPQQLRQMIQRLPRAQNRPNQQNPPLQDQ